MIETAGATIYAQAEQYVITNSQIIHQHLEAQKQNHGEIRPEQPEPVQPEPSHQKLKHKRKLYKRLQPMRRFTLDPRNRRNLM